MIGREASFEFRWRRWALLRDVVDAHLEPHAAGSKRHHNFAAIGGALGTSPLHLPAQALAAELREIRAALAKHPVDDLVLGPITARVLYPTLTLDHPRPLTRAELSQIAPVGDERTLDQYFASLLDSMLEVCAHALPDGTIEVHDG